jgi:hypothetical protein
MHIRPEWTPSAVSALLATACIVAIAQIYMGRTTDGRLDCLIDNLASTESTCWLDVYSVAHFSEGLVFYALGLPLWLQFGLELAENSNPMIERAQASYPYYYGDSLQNSFMDNICVFLGMLIGAQWLRSRRSALGLAIVLEVVMLVAVRDSLLLSFARTVMPRAAEFG